MRNHFDESSQALHRVFPLPTDYAVTLQRAACDYSWDYGLAVRDEQVTVWLTEGVC